MKDVNNAFNPWNTLVFFPREFHELRSLAGYSPWGCRALDMTEQLTLSLFIHIINILLFYLRMHYLACGKIGM